MIKRNAIEEAHKTMSKKTIVTLDTIKKALATIDTRYAVYDDILDSNKFHKNDTSALEYCSIHAVQLDKSLNKNIVFSLYYVNRTTICIHCARRFENVCSESYKLNKKQTEYTRTVSIEELAECVHALLTDECARLKMSKYTQSVTEKKTSATRKASAKAK